MLKDLARATPADAGAKGGNVKAGNVALPTGGSATPYAEALASTGISTQAASRYQALANVPQDVFDQEVISA